MSKICSSTSTTIENELITSGKNYINLVISYTQLLQSPVDIGIWRRGSVKWHLCYNFKGNKPTKCILEHKHQFNSYKITSQKGKKYQTQEKMDS